MSEEIKVGDLVETCSCMPGFVVYIDPNDHNEIEVQELDQIGKYDPGRGGCHGVNNCGIVKISTEKATYMCALGREKVVALYDKFCNGQFEWTNIEAWKKEFEKLRKKKIR